MTAYQYMSLALGTKPLFPACLQVSSEGEIVYTFPPDFQAKLRGKVLRLKLEPAVDKAKVGPRLCVLAVQAERMLSKNAASPPPLKVRPCRSRGCSGGGGIPGPRVVRNCADCVGGRRLARNLRHHEQQQQQPAVEVGWAGGARATGGTSEHLWSSAHVSVPLTCPALLGHPCRDDRNSYASYYMTRSFFSLSDFIWYWDPYYATRAQER